MLFRSTRSEDVDDSVYDLGVGESGRPLLLLSVFTQSDQGVCDVTDGALQSHTHTHTHTQRDARSGTHTHIHKVTVRSVEGGRRGKQ